MPERFLASLPVRTAASTLNAYPFDLFGILPIVLLPKKTVIEWHNGIMLVYHNFGSRCCHKSFHLLVRIVNVQPWVVKELGGERRYSSTELLAFWPPFFQFREFMFSQGDNLVLKNIFVLVGARSSTGHVFLLNYDGDELIEYFHKLQG
jgi:hypothetical protein